MGFVKLDCGMLDSSIWVDRHAREIFITALLMADHHELREEKIQLEVDSLNETGFVIQPGWYGFVWASGSGIVRRSGMDMEPGMEALKRLCGLDPESRSPDYEGRRMARIDGGYIVLNYDKYRQKDHTSAERSKRWRERQLKQKPRKAARQPRSKNGPIAGETLHVRRFEAGEIDKDGLPVQ